MTEQTAGAPAQPDINETSVSMVAVAIAVLAALVAMLVYCKVRGSEPFNYTREDGLAEWATVVAFGLCAILAAVALRVRKPLSRRQQIVLIVFLLVSLMAIGEELSWGQRIFGFAPPKNMNSDSGSEVRFGHNDVTWHNLTFDLGFMKFSLGGFLFSLPLLLAVGFHGVLLPWALRRDKPWARRFVEKVGLFVPSLPLGVVLLVGTIILHFKNAWKPCESNECKEFFVPAVYALILIEWLLTRRPAGKQPDARAA